MQASENLHSNRHVATQSIRAPDAANPHVRSMSGDWKRSDEVD
jgi:hypothetical protein